MSCFLCKKGNREVTCLKNSSKTEEEKICEKCGRALKAYCSECSDLKLLIDLIWDFNEKAYCKACSLKKIPKCCNCDFMSVFNCSCGNQTCRSCGEIHFINNAKNPNHFFFINSQDNLIVPDFNTPDYFFRDQSLVKYIEGTRSMPEAYQMIANFYRNRRVRSFVNNELCSVFGYIMSGYKNFQLSSVPSTFKYSEYDIITYYMPKKYSRNLTTDFSQIQCDNEFKQIDIIRICSYIKYAQLEKSARIAYKAKKLKYAILNNLYPSISTLKAITVYCEIAKGSRLMKKLMKFIKIHFQDSFELIRILAAFGKLYYLKGDYERSGNYFKRSIEQGAKKFPVESEYMSSLQFYYAKSLKNQHLEQSKLLFKIIIKNSLKYENNKLVKKCLDELKSIINKSEEETFNYYYNRFNQPQ